MRSIIIFLHFIASILPFSTSFYKYSFKKFTTAKLFDINDDYAFLNVDSPIVENDAIINLSLQGITHNTGLQKIKKNGSNDPVDDSFGIKFEGSDSWLGEIRDAIEQRLGE